MYNDPIRAIRTLILAAVIVVLAGCETTRRESGPEPHEERVATAPPSAGDLRMTVIDTGAGLCTVTSLPNGNFFIYDAGNKNTATADAIKAIVPANAVVELLVISHTDADHLGSVPLICERARVKRILYPELARDTQTYANFIEAVGGEAETDQAELISLATNPPAAGTQYMLGGASATFVFGVNEPPASWGLAANSAEWRNAGSIVIRLDYAGKSILLCGDTVGRHTGDPQNACIAAEAAMVASAAAVRLDSDVIVAPHHGADNGSSLPFIQAVSPEFVIFSAGSQFAHPRKATAERYLAAGLARERMFRTDLGDDDGPEEWDEGRIAGHNDKSGDDPVAIIITGSGALSVSYAAGTSP